MMPPTHRQEALSKAYVRTVAAKAGIVCSEPAWDYGIDMCLRAIRAEGPPFRDAGVQVDLQIKSTTRASLTETHVRYDLDLKNYEDLRRSGGNCPRLLVVLVLPEMEDQWVRQSMEELTVRHAAYWLSLEGFAPTNSTSSVRVTIPRTNLLSAEALQLLCKRLGERNQS